MVSLFNYYSILPLSALLIATLAGDFELSTGASRDLLKCPKLCAPKETTVRDSNSSHCARLVNLGDQCEPGDLSLRRCEDAFATCIPDIAGISRCQCHIGFVEEDAHCVSALISCPSSISDHNEVNMGLHPPGSPCSVVLDDCDELDRCSKSDTPCNEQADSQSEKKSKDRLVDGLGCLPEKHEPLKTVSKLDNETKLKRGKRHLSSETVSQQCPTGQFCNIYASYVVSECKVRAFGHCCLHSCPLGRPHPIASCAADAELKCSDQEGFYCRRSYLTPETVAAFGLKMDNHFLATCCPNHCPKNTVALNDGHCIPTANVGESCWRDEQCSYTVSCVRGICQCYPDQKMVFRANSHRCVEAQYSQQSTLNLGNSCKNGDICGPTNSVCDGQKCVCMCGYLKHKNSCIKIDGPCPTDKHPQCRTWKLENQCEENPDWMKPNCPQTCEAC